MQHGCHMSRNAMAWESLWLSQKHFSEQHPQRPFWYHLCCGEAATFEEAVMKSQSRTSCSMVATWAGMLWHESCLWSTVWLKRNTFHLISSEAFLVRRSSHEVTIQNMVQHGCHVHRNAMACQGLEDPGLQYLLCMQEQCWLPGSWSHPGASYVFVENKVFSLYCVPWSCIFCSLPIIMFHNENAYMGCMLICEWFHYGTLCRRQFLTVWNNFCDPESLLSIPVCQKQIE